MHTHTPLAQLHPNAAPRWTCARKSVTAAGTPPRLCCSALRASFEMSEGRSSGLSSLFTTGREVAVRLPSEIAVDAVISRAEAAAFHGIPVISMYLQAHPLVDAFIQRSSRPVALALAGAAVVAGLVSST